MSWDGAEGCGRRAFGVSGCDVSGLPEVAAWKGRAPLLPRLHQLLQRLRDQSGVHLVDLNL
ncbi:MAG: hypothetical protein ACAH88_00800, partial [Roseimicrobium sp.]